MRRGWLKRWRDFVWFYLGPSRSLEEFNVRLGPSPPPPPPNPRPKDK